MFASEPFRSSNLQQWQIKDHRGNRLQVPVGAGFILSQCSGKRHSLMSVNLMARQGRKNRKKNCHKFFPFPCSSWPGSERLQEGLLLLLGGEQWAACASLVAVLGSPCGDHLCWGTEVAALHSEQREGEQRTCKGEGQGCILATVLLH